MTHDLTVGQHRMRDLKTTGKRIHTADMGVEQVDRFEALAADLGIEVDAARRETAVLEQRVHALRGEIDVRRELISIPAEEHIARVCVDRAQNSRATGDFHFVLHRMAGERRVVRFQIELQVVDEIKLT